MRKNAQRSRIQKHGPCECEAGVCFEPLEPRLLLSGSWGAGMDAPSLDSQSNTHGNFGPETVTLSEGPDAFGSDALLRNQHALGTGTFVDVLANAPVLDAFDTASAADAIEPVIEATPTSNQTTAETGETATNLTEANPEPQNKMKDAVEKRELVFVNENISDYEQLIADLQGTDDYRVIEVVILDSHRNEIERSSQVGPAIGSGGRTFYRPRGRRADQPRWDPWLTSATLQQNSEAVAAWGNALTESGDILFYGCKIAANSGGQSLLANIAKLTGADVGRFQ